MITALYLTYLVFYGIAGVTFASLLFKLSFSHAVLIVGFSSLAYLVQVWGTWELAKKKQAVIEQLAKQYEEELSKKEGNGVN